MFMGPATSLSEVRHADEAAGGTTNASTDNDETNYHESGPRISGDVPLDGGGPAGHAGQGDDVGKAGDPAQDRPHERRQSYENRPYGWPSSRWRSTSLRSHPYHGRYRVGEGHRGGAARRRHAVLRCLVPRPRTRSWPSPGRRAGARFEWREILRVHPRAPPPRARNPRRRHLTARGSLHDDDKVELPRLFAAG